MVGETGAAGEIFIVDDDPAICETLSIVLSREGYQPTCFSDGASLLAATRVCTPACIVLDVHIPGRSGLDVLKELNAQNYPAPIFIMSGHGDIPMAVECHQAWCVRFRREAFPGERDRCACAGGDRRLGASWREREGISKARLSCPRRP